MNMDDSTDSSLRLRIRYICMAVKAGDLLNSELSRRHGGSPLTVLEMESL